VMASCGGSLLKLFFDSFGRTASAAIVCRNSLRASIYFIIIANDLTE
jgi:hypothetical protein